MDKPEGKYKERKQKGDILEWKRVSSRMKTRSDRLKLFQNTIDKKITKSWKSAKQQDKVQIWSMLKYEIIQWSMRKDNPFFKNILSLKKNLFGCILVVAHGLSSGGPRA